jgi:hypothetical protein
MAQAEEVKRDLGTMEGDNAKLTVHGYGYAVEGHDFGGVTIEEDDTFVLNDVSAWSGFSGDGIVNSGTLEVNASEHSTTFGESILNNGSMQLNSNKTITFADKLYGEGSTDITGTGTVVFNSQLEQDNLEITDATVEIGASDLNVLNAIKNNGVLRLGSGELTNDIVGFDGRVELSGDVTVNSGISNNALAVGTYKLVLGQDGKLELGSFTTDGSELDARNSNMDELSLGDTLLNGDLTSKIDVDLDNITSDTFAASSVDGDGKIDIADVSLSGDSIYRHTHVQIADGDITSAIKTSIEEVSTQDHTYKVSYSNGDLVFTSDANASLVSAVRDGDMAEYVLTGTESVEYGLSTYSSNFDQMDSVGTLADDLVVNGTGEYEIVGDDKGGILIDSDHSLTIKGVSNISGFSGPFVDNENGELTIEDSNVSSSILNNSSMQI